MYPLHLPHSSPSCWDPKKETAGALWWQLSPRWKESRRQCLCVVCSTDDTCSTNCWLSDTRQFHSSHMYLLGVIHKKVSHIPKSRLHFKTTTTTTTPMNEHSKNNEEKIQRVGFLCLATSSEAPSGPAYRNTGHQWCWCMLFIETDLSALSRYPLSPFPKYRGGKLLLTGHYNISSMKSLCIPTLYLWIDTKKSPPH